MAVSGALGRPQGPSRPNRALPFLAWWPLVNRATLKADFIAGLTGALVMLPQGVAFATIAGMPPEYGLYAGIVPTIIAALFGSSWHLVAGPSTTASLVLFSSLSAFAEPGSYSYVQLALTLALMVGLIELGLGLSRLGGIVNFISHTVVVGYTASVGILIIANQLGAFFGLKLMRTSDFMQNLVNFFAHLQFTSIAMLLVALATLATAIYMRRRYAKVPYMIVAILAGSVLGTLFNLLHTGAVSMVGGLPRDLPHFSMPSFDVHVWRMLIPTAIAISISASNEVVSISRALSLRSQQHTDANQEFIGQGLANSVGSFFSGYVVSGSFNRSALNYDSGGQTPMAAIFAGLLLAIVVKFAAPLTQYMPHAAMAASLMMIGWSLIDFKNLRRIIKTSRSERGVLFTTIFAALFVHIQVAIFVGVFLSLLVYLYKTSHPRIVARVPNPQSSARKFTDPTEDLPQCPQFRIVRLDESLFFGAVASFRESIRDFAADAPQVNHLAIVMHGVNFIDIAGAEALVREANRFRKARGGLYLIRPKPRVLELMQRGGYLDEFDAANIFQSKTEAIRTIYRKLDFDICRACSLRVYVECPRKGRLDPVEVETPVVQGEAETPPTTPVPVPSLVS